MFSLFFVVHRDDVHRFSFQPLRHNPDGQMKLAFVLLSLHDISRGLLLQYPGARVPVAQPFKVELEGLRRLLHACTTPKIPSLLEPKAVIRLSRLVRDVQELGLKDLSFRSKLPRKSKAPWCCCDWACFEGLRGRKVSCQESDEEMMVCSRVSSSLLLFHSEYRL